MESKFNENKEYYTIVYFDVLSELQIDFNEYLVLERMLYFSTKNTYTKGISKISNHLKVSRNTVYKTIKSLIEKNHIIEVAPDKKCYYLNPDLKEKFEVKGLKFVKIYHANRKHLEISITQYVFLFMIYSLSKNLQNKIALVSKSYYQKYTGLSDRYYYNTKSKFIENNLLKPQANAFLKLSDNIFNWFENN